MPINYRRQICSGVFAIVTFGILLSNSQICLANEQQNRSLDVDMSMKAGWAFAICDLWNQGLIEMKIAKAKIMDSINSNRSGYEHLVVSAVTTAYPRCASLFQ